MATASASSASSVRAGGELGLRPGRDVRDEDRATHDLQAIAFAEHVLRAAQADALRAVAPGHRRLFGLVRVGPDLHPADVVRPGKDLLELGLVLEPRVDRGQGADVEGARRAIEADPVALLELGAGHAAVGLLAAVVDHQVARTGHAGLADLAGDDRGVRRRAATGRDDAFGHGHPMEVVRRRFDPDQDDLLAALDPFHRGIGVEHGPSDGRAGRGIEPVDDLLGVLEGGRVERRSKELVDVRRLDAPDRLLGRDDPLPDHVDGDLHGRRGGPLGRTRLEHVELAALDRELEVLHVPVVTLELLADAQELPVDRGHVRLHLADLRRGPDTGDDVLALGVGQVLTEEDLLAGVRVSGEGDTGPGVVAHVAEHHRHDVHGRAQVVGDLLVVAVVHGALAEPAREDRLDGQVQLVVRIAREVAAGVLADDRLELAGQRFEGGRIEVRVLGGAVGGLRGIEGVVEALALHVHDDPAEHLDEAPVRVPAEPIVAGQGDEAVQGLLVQAQVQDGVHHPRHRELGA